MYRIYASANWVNIVQVMACRLVGVKPLPEPMLTYSGLDSPLGTTISEIRINVFIHENAFERVVCDIAAILSGGDV